MYKYIFCDLDATLLNDVKRIPKVNIKAINEAKETGVTFMLSTGRLPFCFTEYGKDIDISSYSACNGSIISYKGKIIKDRSLDSKVTERLLEYGIENDLNERIFTRDRLYIVNADKVKSIVLRYFGSKNVTHNEARKLIKEEKIYKICYSSDKRDKLEKAQRDLLGEKLPVEALFSANLFLEFNNIGENKGQGIKDFCDILHEDINKTIAIGDNGNDYSMIKVAGIGACPSNSIDSIKQIADYVARKDNNQGAISEIIDHYIFNR